MKSQQYIDTEIVFNRSMSFIVSAFSAGIDLASSLPWKTIFLIGLSLSPTLVAAANAPVSREEIIRQICEDDSLQAWNNVPNGYVGYDNQRMFASCKDDELSRACKEDKELAHYLTYANPNEYKDRANQAALLAVVDEWMDKVDPKVKALNASLSGEYQSIFSEKMGDIRDIHFRHMDSVISNEGGFCGTFAHRAMHLALNANKKFNLKIKFQIVELSDGEALQKEKKEQEMLIAKGIPLTDHIDMTMKTHAFGFIDSNVGNIAIENNETAVAEALSQLHGFLCDTHQKRTGEISKDKSGLYSGLAGWDTLRIRTMSIDLSSIISLPLDAGRYICSVIQSVKLPIVSTSACSFFANKAQAEQAHREEMLRESQAEIKNSN